MKHLNRDVQMLEEKLEKKPSAKKANASFGSKAQLAAGKESSTGSKLPLTNRDL